MGEQTVYVELVDEGVDVWRPVAASPQPDGHFRIIGPVPEGETWQFPRGSEVRCERRMLGDEAALVAVRLVA